MDEAVLENLMECEEGKEEDPEQHPHDNSNNAGEDDKKEDVKDMTFVWGTCIQSVH